MRNILYSLVFMLVLLLAGSAGVRGGEIPGGGGTVPAYQVWLPVVRVETPCGVSEGIYSITSDRYPPPGPYYHEVSYFADEESDFHPERILVASDYSFESILADGGSFSPIIPFPFASFHIRLELDRLEVGQTYYAKMKYTCDNIPAQTPVLSFVAQEPEEPRP